MRGQLLQPVAGIIYGVGGSAVAWWSIAAVAVAGCLDLCWIAQPKDDADADVAVENVLRRKSTAEFLCLVAHLNLRQDFTELRDTGSLKYGGAPLVLRRTPRLLLSCHRYQ